MVGMKHGSNQRRGRSRGGNGGKRHQSSRNQTFDSNGPEGKVRGTAQQIYDKYSSLARDAVSAGEHITAEGFYQFAEHYYRLANADGGQNQNRQQQNAQRQDGEQSGNEQADESKATASEATPEEAPAVSADAEAASEEKPKRRRNQAKASEGTDDSNAASAEDVSEEAGNEESGGEEAAVQAESTESSEESELAASA